MSRIKKTVAIEPGLDRLVRVLWAARIREGKDATYSSSLNEILSIGVKAFKELEWHLAAKSAKPLD